MVAGQFGIDLGAPGVDSAAQTLDLLEAVSLKISGRIHAARSLMIVDHEQVGARPVSENFLHEFLREKLRVRQLHGVEFFACPDVEKVDSFAGGEALRQFARLDLHGAIGRIADQNMLDYFIEIEILVARANAGESFFRGKAATR